MSQWLERRTFDQNGCVFYSRPEHYQVSHLGQLSLPSLRGR